jgi:hypothetical protein
MNLEITYEWALENIDADGDIIEIYFSDKLSVLDKPGPNDALCLIRNEGNEVGGLQSKYWAYVEAGELPEYFADELGREIAIKVPKVFAKEFNKNKIKQK